jgi:hypothetical protein
MRAVLLMDERRVLGEDRFVEMTIWQLPQPLTGSLHHYKYRLACVIDEVCVMRYDDEARKGDHKHLGEREVSYVFTTLDQMVDDFLADAARM